MQRHVQCAVVAKGEEGQPLQSGRGGGKMAEGSACTEGEGKGVEAAGGET